MKTHAGSFNFHVLNFVFSVFGKNEKKPEVFAVSVQGSFENVFYFTDLKIRFLDCNISLPLSYTILT